MTQTKTKHSLREASPVAEQLVALLAPCCERIEVAGSIRREKWEVGDIELLCIPNLRTEQRQVDMFTTEDVSVDELDIFLTRVVQEGLFSKRLKSNGALAGFGPKNKLLLHRASGIPVDVFTTDARNWGMALLVRTGPAEFNIEVMSRLKTLGHAGHAYRGITIDTFKPATRREVDCPDEETVFRHLRWGYIPPSLRGKQQVVVR